LFQIAKNAKSLFKGAFICEKIKVCKLNNNF